MGSPINEQDRNIFEGPQSTVTLTRGFWIGRYEVTQGDMAGNVWEWCQDWYGNQVGGLQSDPQGPASKAQGAKIMRGGAYDYDNSSCRSASRFFASRTGPIPTSASAWCWSRERRSFV